ncbi:MlaD family protein [Lacibacter sp. H375]|uniref:MlaD family protein n=1 Tax=Lacibacter sp. H375 TaxID=3133424 RepID=UPI0030C436EE
MKVSNETKVGALTVIAVTLLILGFNFLKGKTLLKKSNVLYARFPDVGALEPANQVKIKGYRIGNVYKIDKLDKDVSEVVVTINLLDEINIPSNSVAVINSSLTGNSSISVLPGNSKTFLAKGDTLLSASNPDILSKITTSIDPVMANVKQAVDSLKLLLSNVNSMFDEKTKANLRHTIANLKSTSDELNVMLNSKNGALSKTLNNVEAFTTNLNTNNEKLNTTIENFKTTSQKLSELQLKETVTNLNNSITQLQGILQKANSKDGSLGLLIHDPKLYNNLQNTTRSLNILLDDFKLHPKRYINVSVFGGKKDKSEPLKAPLADSIYNNQK